MSLTTIVLAVVAMGAGSCVQGAVGFGSNLLAAPFLVLLDERFVPGPITVASIALNVLLITTRSDVVVDQRVRWAVIGLVPGTVAGGLVLATLPAEGLSIAFAVIVVSAVAVSISGWTVAVLPRSLASAGVASGLMGTVSGIGGPPIALVYQHESAALLRGTLPRFFLVGSLLSVVAISAAGHLGADEIVPSLVLIGAALGGSAVSAPVARHLDRRSARPVVLGLSMIAAVAVLVRELT